MSGTRETLMPIPCLRFNTINIHLNLCILACLALFQLPNASVNRYHKGILKGNSVLMHTTMLTSLSVLIVQGEVTILNYGLLIMSTICCLKCKGRASYLNPCYLTSSCRTSNQVKSIFVWKYCVFLFSRL